MDIKRPEPPAGLTPGAADLWRSIVEDLDRDRLTAPDLPLLAAYCTAADRKRQVDALIAAEGFIVEHAGFRMVNGSAGESNDLATLLCTLAVKLRLSQSSRIRADSASLRLGDR